jgi:hypothetical protein
MHTFNKDETDMNHSAAITSTAPAPNSTRVAGVAIAIATVASTVAVALDQGGGGSNQLEILQSIAQLATQKALVHGVAMASVAAYAFGYSSLSRRLGLHRPLVLAGLVAYLIGCMAMIGATVMDGFVTPHIAADAIVGSADRIRIAYELVHDVGLALTDLAKLGWLLQAVGSLAWAMALMGSRGLGRGIGVVGSLSSAMVCIAVLASPMNMSMTAILGVLLAQSIWNIAAAVLLIRSTGQRAETLSLPMPVMAT